MEGLRKGALGRDTAKSLILRTESQERRKHGLKRKKMLIEFGGFFGGKRPSGSIVGRSGVVSFTPRRETTLRGILSTKNSKQKGKRRKKNNVEDGLGSSRPKPRRRGQPSSAMQEKQSQGA